MVILDPFGVPINPPAEQAPALRFDNTPGPWCLSLSGRYVRYEGVRGFNVCDLDVFGGPPVEAAGNARLIVAAPALALAWALVPDEMKLAIYEFCHQSGLDWIMPAIEAIPAEPPTAIEIRVTEDPPCNR
jgi:hypothetical protein